MDFTPCSMEVGATPINLAVAGDEPWGCDPPHAIVNRYLSAEGAPLTWRTTTKNVLPSSLPATLDQRPLETGALTLADSERFTNPADVSSTRSIW